jgi:hypothetical protein
MADTGDGENSTHIVARLLSQHSIPYTNSGLRLQLGNLLLNGGDLA